MSLHVNKIVIFGNSGSGKSTLAKRYVQKYNFAHLDLDTLAWKDSTPPQRESLDKSIKRIKDFRHNNESWVIEGCYSDLLEYTLTKADKIIFLNPSVEVCIDNSKERGFESHKYMSKEQQDANLPMLIEWIKGYANRQDEFSLKAHQELFDHFSKEKVLSTSNDELAI